MSNDRNEMTDSVREWREIFAKMAAVTTKCDDNFAKMAAVTTKCDDNFAKMAEVTTKCDDNFALDGAVRDLCRDCVGVQCDADYRQAGGGELTEICNKCDSDMRRQDWTDEDSARVLAHQIPHHILERTVRDGDFETIEEAEEAGAEFLKYLVLVMSSDQRIGMVSTRVDLIWHAYILWTKEYHQLSRNVLGVTYFHHSPTRTDGDNSSSGDGGARNFLASYAARFGALPSVWLRDEPDARALESKCSKDDGFPCGPGADCN
jgi:hypothetical protein